MKTFIFGVLVVLVLVPAVTLAEPPALTLAEAERLALEHAPVYAHHRTAVDAARERTVYEGRLPDPQLTLGAVNVPTDTYKLNQEDMTMVTVGVRQAFPPGDTLALRTRRAEQNLKREEAYLEIQRRNLLRDVRRTWFDLYFANATITNLIQTRSLLERQIDAAEGRYRAAQDTQQTVLRARQALARLDEKTAEQRAQKKRLQAWLSRWIGAAAYTPLPEALPELPPVAESFDVAQHPDWLAAQAGVEAARAEVDIARQEYKPGMMLDLSYGIRQNTPSGANRPDMVSAMLTVDLPVFRSKRQDRRLAEKQAMEAGMQWEAEDKRRELEAQYQALHAEHEALTQRVQIVEQRLLPEVRRAAQLTVAGFAREQTELREAHLQELNTELELTRLRVERARAQTEMLYFTGEPQP